jgi:hypothetical protein
MLARLRPYVLLFFGLTVVYHANLRPVDSGDALPASLVPFAIFIDHTITLDRFAPWLRGHVWYASNAIHQAHGNSFSDFPLGTPLLVTPLYLPIAFLALHERDPGSLVMLARIAQKFSAAAVAALSAVLLLLLLRRIATPPWAWVLTLVYALATETWAISSQALWQHGPGELAIIGCFYGLERWSSDRARNGWLWLCGLCVAASFVIRPTNIVLLPAVLVALFIAKATLTQHIRLLAVPLLGGALLVSYNLYVFERPSGGYAVAVLNGSVFPGLAGLFLSPGRGLLIYTPVALFAVCAWLPSASAARRRHHLLYMTAAIFIIFEPLAISRSISWWGGYCWGPRMLTELAPALIILIALGVSAMDRPWLRRTFAVLALYSVFIQMVGVFFYPKGHWDAAPTSVDNAPDRLWDWRDNPIVRTVRGGLYWEPYAIVGAALTSGLPAAQKRLRELNVNPYP